MSVSVEGRTREVIDARGRTVKSLRFFCPLQQRSLTPASCAKCPRVIRVEPDRVECDLPRATLVPSVGMVADRRVVCVRPEVEIEHADQLCERERALFLPVVEGHGLFRGVLWRRDLRKRPSRPGDLLAGIRQVLRVEDAMDTRPLGIDEHAHVLDAASAMRTERTRSLVVTTLKGVVVGVLTDLALLRWMAASRHAP